MKDKNLPDDNISESIEELTNDANKIIEELEKEKNLQNAMETYQKLIKLNGVIERKFYKKSKQISDMTKEKISKIISKKNDKKFK